MVRDTLLKKRKQYFKRLFIKLVVAINDRLKVSKLAESSKQVGHLAVVDATVIKAHPIDIFL